MLDSHTPYTAEVSSPTMAFQITEDGAASLRNRIRAAVTNPKTDIPGTVVTIVNQTGDLIFSEACGQLGADTNDAMTVNNIFWLASCTKLILTIATMQLVEKGQLELDNADQVERLCPRLTTVKIVKRDEKGKLYYVEKTKRITLRMLLTHTGV
jgi:CubicO group peptidase (beta-lactamase class C family)